MYAAGHSFIRRTAAFLYRAPRSINALVEERVKGSYCISSNGTRFLKTCKINNNRDRTSIKIGSNCLLAGELLTFGHGGSISIGDHCFLGENSRLWSARSIIIGNQSFNIARCQYSR